MDSKGENKSIKILVVILCIVLFAGICLTGVLGYMNYDMNRKLNEKKQDVDKQVAEAEQKLAELQKQGQYIRLEIQH